MKNIKFLLTILSFIFCFSSFAQNSFYTPEGKTSMEVSTEQILVKFKSGVAFEAQKQILGNAENLVPLIRENLLPAPIVTLVQLSNGVTEQGVETLLNQLRVNEKVDYANPFLAHKDGTLQGITDKLIVGLKNPADEAVLVNLAKGFGAEIENRNEFDPLQFHLKVSKSANRNSLEIANSLYETGLFAFAEPDFLRLMKRMNTNDPLVGNQWSLNNDGVNTSQYGGVVGADMKVYSAWNTSTGSSSIKVAIIDEGVDLVHPDLVANLLPGYDATGQGSGGAPSGDDAHGTACAGIVAGVGNNSTGVAGVAYGSKIIPVRIAYSNAQGNWVTSNTWIANALNWSWQTAGADILSNSWGGGSSSSAINNAINGSITSGRGGLGAPVIFAAGNGNGAVGYPGSNNETIAVIAMSMCNERKNPSSCDGETWWGSDHGTHADVAAPGVKIYATDISGAAGYSSGDYVSNFNGTSSACPNTAGVMALILSVDGNLTEQAARAALETTCDKVGGYTYSTNGAQPNGTWSTDLGYGRVNAQAALNSLTPPANDDAGISAVIDPSGTICATSATPIVTLKNYGANTLSSVDIVYSVDGGSSSTYNWTGSLASQATTNVTLSAVSFSSGSHTFNANTNNPNGTADSNTNNDAGSSSFNSGDQGITLSILTDNYASETTWDIRDGSGNVVASGGPYAQNNTTFTHNLCVASACFDLTIYDSYGDGICCAYGNGSYSLTEDATGNTLASGGSFGSSETTNFCVPSAPPSQYTLTTNTNGNGSVSPGGTYNGGSSVTISATPDAGYQFDGWSGDLSGSTNPITFTISSNMNVTANFSLIPPNQYTLTTSTNGNGTVTPGGTYNAGTSLTISATPDAGYQFDNWSGDLSGSTNPITFTINANMSVTANFSSTGGGGCSYSTIDNEGFESGWGIWNDGGSDCRKSANDSNYANNGTYCVRLRDNTSTSVMTTDVLDLSGYDELTVDFSCWIRSFEGSEDFWLQISTNGGSSYTTVEDWVKGVDFNNNERIDPSVVIAGPFTNNCRLRFRADASGNSDWAYFDDVHIQGCSGTGGNSVIVGNDYDKDVDSSEDEAIEMEVSLTELELFPNPVSSELTVAYEIQTDTEYVNLIVTDFTGKVIQRLKTPAGVHNEQIDVSQFVEGYYLVHLISGQERTAKKFVVIK
ncbi:MAG: S8 family serine peptidase [Bacteroidetes bacterium]|nr:S8 family serine peptidase [Bacteroidota bacterium]